MASSLRDDLDGRSDTSDLIARSSVSGRIMNCEERSALRSLQFWPSFCAINHLSRSTDMNLGRNHLETAAVSKALLTRVGARALWVMQSYS